MKAAILDLGTNTFHLLIVNVDGEKNISVLFKTEKFVKLAEDGIDFIGERAFQRAVNQVKEYADEIKKYHVEKIIAFGTAAFRKAKNATELIDKIKSETGIEIKVIEGNEEAELIYLGVRAAISLDEEPVLIMDIGGGSTEFIIANNEKIFWRQSFPIGATTLKQKFHLSEPISAEEISTLKNYLGDILKPLEEIFSQYNIKSLIGASGSFDSFSSMCESRYHGIVHRTKSFSELFIPRLKEVLEEMKRKNLEERLATEGLIAFRAEMITVGAILTEFVLDKFMIEKVFQSDYALKEGALEKYLF